MKKLIQAIFCLVLSLMVLLARPARADVGPKPSVTLEILGIEDKTAYYTSLLSQEGSGPFWPDQEIFPPSEYKTEEEYQAELKFADFDYKDGYKYLASLLLGTLFPSGMILGI